MQKVIPIQAEAGVNQPKPRWLKVKAPLSPEYKRLVGLMREKRLNTVCEEASCPNIGDCWHKGSATFMILGRVCTRACAFCDVETGRPDAVDAEEPAHIAEAVALMGLKHVVITSVDRDDLPDGGAAQFGASIRAVHRKKADAVIEVLTPDFRRKQGALETVVEAKPDIFNHNLETVPRLYHSVRPGARYFTSLRLLQQAKETAPGITTKSGIMVGLGEELHEVLQVLDDLREVDVDILTIGQYLRPSVRHHPVARYWEPEAFDDLKQRAERKGFKMVACSPLTRSSFHAGEVYAAMKQANE